MRSRWFLLTVLAMVLMFVSGCCSKKVQSEPAEVAQAEEVQETEVVEEVVAEPQPQEVPPTPMEEYELEYAKLPLQHTVVKGECLWWIAEYQNIYNDPFMWPLIFKANRGKIDNPDLIYPDQTFYIPRSFDLNELKDSRRSAGAPSPYTPLQDANVPADVRSELGWSFGE